MKNYHIRILVLDDRRWYSSGGRYIFTHVQHPDEAINLISKSTLPGNFHYNEIWLDHDLGPSGDSKSVVSFLAKLGKENEADGENILPETIRNISDNPVNREAVESLSPWYETAEATRKPDMWAS